MRKQKLLFVHEEKAAYPEVAAYKDFFSNDFVCEEVLPDQLKDKDDLVQSLCWMIMGYYPTRPAAMYVIHDYRSLSVGRGRWLKDKLKRYTNARPNLRIYQNEAIASQLGFDDNVPSLYIPMGVPSFVDQYRVFQGDKKSCDFIYIGEVSKERRSYLMFDSFLKRFGNRKIFHVYGASEESFIRSYEKNINIVFKGKHTQNVVFEALRHARVAVNYFPDHAPHIYQTPTKLLEYAALGLKVLSNEHPQSRLATDHYGLQSWWGRTEDMFKDLPEDLNWPDNQSFDPSPLMWPFILKRSGVRERVQEVWM